MQTDAGAFPFLWEKPRSGFVLRSDVRTAGLGEALGSAGEKWLVERQPAGVPRELERYAPLAVPALHREFARVDVSDERRLRHFANEYGFLGLTQRLMPDLPGPQESFAGESLADRRREHDRLRRLLDLWDDARGSANLGMPVDADLAGRIIWHDGPPRQVDLKWPERGWEHIIAREPSLESGDDGLNAFALAAWSTDDLAAPARFLVVEQVNKALRGQASPAVLPYRQNELAIVPTRFSPVFT